MIDNRMEERLIGSQKDDDTSNMARRVWAESKMIWRIAFPTILSRISQYGMLVVTQSFMGYISNVDLAAYALVQTILVRLVQGLLIGMSSATETLCGQAFGAKQYHMMGIYLQRSWIIDAISATIFVPVFLFATPILRIVGQEESVATVAGPIALWFIPVIYSFVLFYTMQMYLQAQMKNMVVGLISVASFILHFLLSWILVSKLELGMSGAMGALTISYWVMVIGQFFYVVGGWCPLTWRGFAKAAFFDMLPVVKLSISSGVMLCLEIWYNAILVLLAGYMKNAAVAISAFSICVNINVWELMLCLGFLAAACVRVANELGSGNAKSAEFSVKVLLSITTSLGAILFIVCMVFGREIAYKFTKNEQVVASVSDLSPLLAFSIFLNGIQAILSGVAVGIGNQSLVAKINLFCYYIIGIPIGILLGYVIHLQVKGIWVGMICGVISQTLALSFITWRIDWNHQVNITSERLNRWFLKNSEDPDQIANDE